MHLQKLRQSGDLHLPSTRQRNDGFHENQFETEALPAVKPLVSPLIFPSKYLKDGADRLFKDKLLKAAVLSMTLSALTAPEVLAPPTAEARPADKPIGTWGRTSGSATYIRIRPGTGTPIVAKVPRGTQLMVWGTFKGWYRVETTDHKFGWIHHDLVVVPRARKLKELSHAKAKKASDRTGYQTLYGKPAQLKKYYAAYKAPGAKTGLKKQGVSLASKPSNLKRVATKSAVKPPVGTPIVKTVSTTRTTATATPTSALATAGMPFMPREVTIVVAEPKKTDQSVEQTATATPAAEPTALAPAAPRPVTPRSVTPRPTVIKNTPTKPRPVKATAVVSRKTVTKKTTVRVRNEKQVAPMSPGKLPQITATDILDARRAHMRNQPTSRSKSRSSIIKSSPNSTIKTAPPAKPVVSSSAKVQPTAGRRNKSVKPVYAKVSPSRGGSPRDYARYAAAKSKFGSGMATQALAYRGMPYIRGASSPRRGFDCSGLVYHLLRARGLNPPRTAAGLASYGKKVAKGELKPGDMVFFANTYKRGISHIGIYIGNNKFVHAANRRAGVKTDSLNASYYARKYWGARRVQ